MPEVVMGLVTFFHVYTLYESEWGLRKTNFKILGYMYDGSLENADKKRKNVAILSNHFCPI